MKPSTNRSRHRRPIETHCSQWILILRRTSYTFLHLQDSIRLRVLEPCDSRSWYRIEILSRRILSTVGSDSKVFHFLTYRSMSHHHRGKKLDAVLGCRCQAESIGLFGVFERFFQPMFELTERFTRHEVFCPEILMGLLVWFANLCVEDQFNISFSSRESLTGNIDRCMQMCVLLLQQN